MHKPYKLGESLDHAVGLSTEFFIDTPNGCMSVRMPHFVSTEEQQRRLKVIVAALNNN